MKANKRWNTRILVTGVVLGLLILISLLYYFKGDITGLVVYAPPASCYNNYDSCIDLNGDGIVDYDDESIFAQILNGSITNTSDPIIYHMADFDNSGVVDNEIDFQQCFVYFRDEAQSKAGGVVICNPPEDNFTGRINVSECISGCPDLNGDGYVNSADENIFSLIFEDDLNESHYPMADLTGDGTVDWQDRDCFIAFSGKIVSCNMPVHVRFTNSCPDLTSESDTGNDGYVDSIDKAFFEQYKEDQNLKADFNGDDEVNLIDELIFEEYLSKVVTCNLYHAPWHVGGIDQNNSDTTESGFSQIGNTSNVTYDFTTSREGELTKIRFYLKYDNASSSSPVADNIIIKIHPDASGAPNTSTLIAETIIAGFTDNRTIWKTAYFAIPPILENGAKYHITLSSPDSTEAVYKWISNAEGLIFEQFSSTACADINGDGICNAEDEEIIERLPDGMTSDGVGDFNNTLDINSDYIINQTDHDIITSAIGNSTYLEKPAININNPNATSSMNFGYSKFLAQSFKATNTRLSKISLYLAANSVSKREITLDLYDDNNETLGLNIASVKISGFDNHSFNWFDFIFNDTISLVIGNTYYMVISASDTSIADAYDWSLSAAYAYGNASESTTSGSAWTILSNDFAFETYSGDLKWNDSYDVNNDFIIDTVDLNLIFNALGSWDGVWWTPLVDFNAQFGMYEKLLDKTLGFDAYTGKVLTCGLPTWSASCGNGRCDKDEDFTSCMEDCPACNYDEFCSTAEDFDTCDDCAFWKALPNFDKFNGDTTAFESLSIEEMESVSDMVLEILPYGKIEFSEQVNVSGLDFDSHVDISHNYTSINTSALPGLNKNATITLYNLSFIYPGILIDNASCDESICSYHSYDNNNLIFDVSGFNSYSSEELAPDTALFNGSTTDFSIAITSNLEDVSNIIIENTAHGRINFLEPVNTTKGNYSRDISIGKGRISVNTSADQRLNKSARIELYDLGFYQPIIYMDGSQCPASICSIESYPFSAYEQLCAANNCSLIFDATHFTEYDIRENTTAPQFIRGPISPITFDANTEYRFNLSYYFFDQNNDSLIYGAEISVPDIGARFEDGEAILNNTLGWSGVGWINFTASDGNNTASSGNVVVLVLTNRPPQYMNDPISYDIMPWEEDQNNTIDLGYYFDDPDGDNLSYSPDFIGSSDNITIIINNTEQKAYLIPDTNWHGSRFIVFSAEDEEFSIESTTMQLEVESINDMPELIEEIDEAIIWDEDNNMSLNLTDYFEDVEDDSENLDYSLSTAPVNFNVEFTGADMKFTPDPNWFGSEDFMIHAEDSDGGIGHSNPFTIYIKQINDPVTRTNKSFELTWKKNENLSIRMADYFEDIDGDAIYWFSHNLPSKISIDMDFISGDTIFISEHNWGGTEQVNLSAMDTISSVSEIINLTVVSVEITDSTINGTYYAFSDSLDIPGISFSTIINDSTIIGPTIDVLTSEIYNSTIINSPIRNCIIYDAVLENNYCENSFIDPSNIRESNTTGSIIIDSEVLYSDVINSNLIGATVHHSEVISLSIENSTLYKTEITGATIINETIYNGTITLPNGTDQTITSPIDLAEVINYPPIAVIDADIVIGTETLTVSFDASASTDPNIPGSLNDILTYSWDFENDGTIDATGITTSQAYETGTFTAVLTVTDKFNETSSHDVIITVDPAVSTTIRRSSGGGGGGGGRLVAVGPVGAKYSRFYSYLDAGTTEVKISHKEIAMKSLTLTTNQGATRVNFIVQNIENISILDNPPKDAYQHLSITAEGLTDDIITNVKHNFSINKSWFSQYDKDKVYLHRYHNGKWQKISAVFAGEDDNSYYYEASTSGLSYFTITAAPSIELPAELEVIEVPEPVEQPVVTERPELIIQKEELPEYEPEPEEEMPKTLNLISLYIGAIIVLLISLGIGLVFYLKGKKKTQREENQLKKLKEESMEQLYNYAQEMMQQGYNKEQIKDILLKEDWDESILDEMFLKFD